MASASKRCAEEHLEGFFSIRCRGLNVAGCDGYRRPICMVSFVDRGSRQNTFMSSSTTSNQGAALAAEIDEGRVIQRSHSTASPLPCADAPRIYIFGLRQTCTDVVRGVADFSATLLADGVLLRRQPLAKIPAIGPRALQCPQLALAVAEVGGRTFVVGGFGGQRELEIYDPSGDHAARPFLGPCITRRRWS